MSTTLSFGYKLPQTGDRGATVFTALEDNITRVNSHDHDGTDSDRVDLFDLRRGSVAVDATSWLSSGNLYRKSVSLPAGFTVANGSEWGKAGIRFFLSGGSLTGQECFPKTEKIDDTTFYLYSPVNNQAFSVVFS